MSGLGNNPIIEAFANSVSPAEYVRLLAVSGNLSLIIGSMDNITKLQSGTAEERAQITEQLHTAFSALTGAGEFAKGLIDRLGNDGIEALLNGNVFSADAVATIRQMAGSSPVITLYDEKISTLDQDLTDLRKDIDQLLGQSHPASAWSHKTACRVGFGAAVAGCLLAGADGEAAAFIGGAAFGGGVVLIAQHCLVA
jgi:hypothetical protein